ncbi:MAG: ABC transporter substrate-binding protein [Candidatus Curtissbacteria bacterium]|nr:ABC transporter substrate-binding protein [Candidatus Curtissbacteria bacterium]
MISPKARVRKIKFWFNLTKAYFHRYKLRVFIGLVSIAAFIWLLSFTWSKMARSNVLTIGYTGSYTLEDVPAEILNLATEPLIAVDESGKPVPALASHWTVSEDGKTYVVFLKDNLRWHDDTPVEAKDIRIAIENVQITALNNKAIEFKLPNKISSFPNALNRPVFKAESFYGTGHYRIVDLDRSDEIIQKISLAPKDKNLPQVDIKFYQREDQLTEAIKMGEVKSAAVANASIFNSWPNLEVQRTVEEKEVITIFYNTEDPNLTSKELRQALTHAIDKSAFDGESASGPNSPSSWVYNDQVKRFDYNTGRAKELLAKSGSTNPTITLSVIGGFTDIANSIKEDWGDIGVTTNIKEEKALPREFQALLAINEVSSNIDQYGLWHSTQKSTNITKFKNPRIDKLLEDARDTNDDEKRKELYQDFQRVLVDETPAAFLYHPYKYQVIYKNAKPLLDKLPDQ